MIAGRYEPNDDLEPAGGAQRVGATDTTSGAAVVVTTFPRGAGAGEFAAIAARYEAVRHPSLAAVLAWSDPGSDETVAPIIVTARIAGRALNSDPPRPRSEALALLADVADAIAALHGAGLAHGCLADSSIVVPDAGPATVDGAGAVALRDAALGGSPTVSDVTADVRSIGEILYRTLTGHPSSGEATIAPTQLDPTIGASLNGLTLALLSTDPLRPPPPAAAVALRLRALAADDEADRGATTARPTGLGAARRLLPRGDVGLVAAAGAIALAGIGVSFAVARGERAATGRTSVRTVTIISQRAGIPSPPVTQYVTQEVTLPGAAATVTIGGSTFPGTVVYTFRLIPTTIAQAGPTTLNIPLTVTIPPP